MDKKSYYVITIEENGKCISYVEVIQNSNNLVNVFPKNANTINACDSKNRAKEIARFWNEIWEEKGMLNYAVKPCYV